MTTWLTPIAYLIRKCEGAVRDRQMIPENHQEEGTEGYSRFLWANDSPFFASTRKTFSNIPSFQCATLAVRMTTCSVEHKDTNFTLQIWDC